MARSWMSPHALCRAYVLPPPLPPQELSIDGTPRLSHSVLRSLSILHTTPCTTTLYHMRFPPQTTHFTRLHVRGRTPGEPHKKPYARPAHGSRVRVAQKSKSWILPLEILASSPMCDVHRGEGRWTFFFATRPSASHIPDNIYEICMIDVRLRFSARARPHISHGRAPRARPLTPRRARPRARGNRHARARRFVSPQFVC